MAREIAANWDDMVFADREKEFGAYVLRKSYPRHLMIGTLLVSALVLLGAYAPLLAKRYGWFEAEISSFSKPTEIIMTTPPPINPPEDREEIVLPPPPERPAASVEFRVPEPVAEADADPMETMATVTLLEDAPNFGAETVEGEALTGMFTGDLGNDRVPDVIVDRDPGPDIFIGADEEPVAINISDIVSLIGYPQLARDANIEGTVVARILVDKLGNYERHIIAREVHPFLQEAVEKHLSKLKFSPAIQGNRPIKFWVNVPFRISLMK